MRSWPDNFRYLFGLNHRLGAELPASAVSDAQPADRWIPADHVGGCPASLRGVCIQCVAAAMGTTAAATGTRSYIAAKHFSWVTPRRMRRITIGLLASALLASSLIASGSSSPVAHSAPSTAGHVQRHS